MMRAAGANLLFGLTLGTTLRACWRVVKKSSGHVNSCGVVDTDTDYRLGIYCTTLTGDVGNLRVVPPLLGGEVYLYHAKLMMKDAFTGGRHVWHQDYGYWYKNGCLTPDLLTVYTALDRCTKENGCLQVLRGSHKCGRVDHSFVAGQTGIDKERLMHLMEKYETTHVEMEPGDAMFFHSNLVHMADHNKSPLRRWTLLYAYNLRENNPVYKHHHPQYSYLHKVPNSAIKDCENYSEMSGKEFLNPSEDKTVKA